MALRKSAQLFGSRLLPSVSCSLGSLSAAPAMLADAAQAVPLGDSTREQRRELFIPSPLLLFGGLCLLTSQPGSPVPRIQHCRQHALAAPA